MFQKLSVALDRRSWWSIPTHVLGAAMVLNSEVKKKEFEILEHNDIVNLKKQG